MFTKWKQWKQLILAVRCTLTGANTTVAEADLATERLQTELARVAKQRDRARQQRDRILELHDTCYNAVVDISHEPEPPEAPDEPAPDTAPEGDMLCHYLPKCDKLCRGGKCQHGGPHPWDDTCEVHCFFGDSNVPTCIPIIEARHEALSAMDFSERKGG